MFVICKPQFRRASNRRWAAVAELFTLFFLSLSPFDVFVSIYFHLSFGRSILKRVRLSSTIKTPSNKIVFVLSCFSTLSLFGHSHVHAQTHAPIPSLRCTYVPLILFLSTIQRRMVDDGRRWCAHPNGGPNARTLFTKLNKTN